MSATNGNPPAISHFSSHQRLSKGHHLPKSHQRPTLHHLSILITSNHMIPICNESLNFDLPTNNAYIYFMLETFILKVQKESASIQFIGFTKCKSRDKTLGRKTYKLDKLDFITSNNFQNFDQCSF